MGQILLRNKPRIKKPKFTGSDQIDFIYFFDSFQRYTKYYDIRSDDDRATIFGDCLQGNALLFYETLDPKVQDSYFQLKRVFENKYSVERCRILKHMQLNSRKMRENEGLESYAFSISKSAKFLCLSDSEKMNVFINGLEKEIKTYVLLQFPTTFDEALEAAERKDSALQYLRWEVMKNDENLIRRKAETKLGKLQVREKPKRNFLNRELDYLRDSVLSLEQNLSLLQNEKNKSQMIEEELTLSNPKIGEEKKENSLSFEKESGDLISFKISFSINMKIVTSIYALMRQGFLLKSYLHNFYDGLKSIFSCIKMLNLSLIGSGMRKIILNSFERITQNKTIMPNEHEYFNIFRKRAFQKKKYYGFTILILVGFLLFNFEQASPNPQRFQSIFNINLLKNVGIISIINFSGIFLLFLQQKGYSEWRRKKKIQC